MNEILNVLRETTRTRRIYTNQRYNDHEGQENVQLQSIGLFDRDHHESYFYITLSQSKENLYKKYWRGRMNKDQAALLKKSIGRMLEIEFDMARSSLERKK